jgi:TrmH family RNA methyltransferase
VKEIHRLRQRSHRDEANLLLIEGYREVKRALENRVPIQKLYYCPGLYQGKHEPALVQRCAEQNIPLLECSLPVFTKISYRDRPEGLLALAPQIRKTLCDLSLPQNPLLLIGEHIEKPGNLGTMLRTADAAGVDALIVCDRCTDVNNPNVVRASIGALFSVPLAEASSEETIPWLKQRGIKILAASPHAAQSYTQIDMTQPTAIVVGAEQYGLSETWMSQADYPVQIPMFGQADSLNVAAAATSLPYEAARQRPPPPPPRYDSAR